MRIEIEKAMLRHYIAKSRVSDYISVIQQAIIRNKDLTKIFKAIRSDLNEDDDTRQHLSTTGKV